MGKSPRQLPVSSVRRNSLTSGSRSRRAAQCRGDAKVTIPRQSTAPQPKAMDTFRSVPVDAHGAFLGPKRRAVQFVHGSVFSEIERSQNPERFNIA